MSKVSMPGIHSASTQQSRVGPQRCPLFSAAFFAKGWVSLTVPKYGELCANTWPSQHPRDLGHHLVWKLESEQAASPYNGNKNKFISCLELAIV